MTDTSNRATKRRWHLYKLSQLVGLDVAAVHRDRDRGWVLELSDGRVVPLGSNGRVRHSGALAETLSDAGGVGYLTAGEAKRVAAILPQVLVRS